MNNDLPYKSPESLRRALTDRLRAQAAIGKWPLPQLQRQLAYDRLLQRLYLAEAAWVIKGATALQARGIGARATNDINLYKAGSQDEAEADLRAAVERTINDGFRFELGASVVNSFSTRAIPVTAYVGTTVWAKFRVDLVGDGVRMTQEPESTPPLVQLDLPDFKQDGYRVVSIVDHVADKVAATYEVHGGSAVASTRYKDLIDLVAIVQSSSPTAGAQRKALDSEFERRRLTLPTRFGVPDLSDWTRGYASEARRVGPSVPDNLEDALAIVSAFLNPVLAGTAEGTWNYVRGAWGN